MNKYEQSVYDAKKALKSHIKFMESILNHLSGSDENLKSGAMFAAWCIHQYMTNNLINDIEKTVRENKNE